MNTKEMTWLVVVAVVSGLIGGGVAGWLAAGAPAFAKEGAKTPAVLQAQKLELVDAHGDVHAGFEIGVDGNPALVFYDVDHHARAVLDLTGGGNARLFLADNEGVTRAMFGLGKNGDPFLHFRDATREVIWSAP